MTTLTIYTDDAAGTITAVEYLYGDKDNAKYVESFATWGELFARLGEHMRFYAGIEVK